VTRSRAVLFWDQAASPPLPGIERELERREWQKTRKLDRAGWMMAPAKTFKQAVEAAHREHASGGKSPRAHSDLGVTARRT